MLGLNSTESVVPPSYSQSMTDGAIGDAIAMIRAGFDALFTSTLSSLSSSELTAVMVELEVERRRGDSFDQHLIAEAAERGTAGEYARTSTVDLLMELLRVSPREAKARVARARDMGPRRELTGQPLEPSFVLVSGAQRSGAISAEHASVITNAVDRIPVHLAMDFTDVVERALVETALHVDPRELAKAGERLLARIDQDGNEPREAEQQRREWGIAMKPDGTGVPYGRFTAGLCAVWNPIIDALSAPLPSEEGERDDRTAGQRRHDGLLEAGLRLLRSGTLPDSGGVPVTILVHIDADQLREQTGVAETGHGDLLPVAELLRLAAEAQIIPVVTNDAGGVLSYGQRRRLASCGQRLALADRDGGCSFPGCTRPPAWCEAHHVIAWNVGGPTDLDNLCLVCAFHHREFERRGWAVRIRDGVPEWIPPPWLDPRQRPRRNRARPVLAFASSGYD